MMALLNYPQSAALKRVVPKSRIYDAVKAPASLREKFVSQVEQVIWAFKLAPETINLPATKSVPEIQVFRIILKTNDVSDDVLRAIDRAIPFPIIFELEADHQVQVVAAHKRPSEADGAKWVISDHLHGEWQPADAARAPMPVALNLLALYDQILTGLMSIESMPTEDMTTRMERLDAIKAKEREIGRLKSKLKRETQFNIKMTLHGELREAQAEFEHLKKPE